MNEQFPRFYVQGETVRGEPRVYWVVDRQGHRSVTMVTTDKRQADRWCRYQTAANEQLTK